MFLQVSVILSTGGGGCLPQCMLGCHTPPDGGTPPRMEEHPPQMEDPPGWRNPPRWRNPPGWRNPPRMEEPPLDGDPPGWRNPPQTRQTPPPPGSKLQHTTYERPVRILLECILVCNAIANAQYEIVRK